VQCTNLNTLAHRLWRSTVRPGDRVVDATAGRGHDALQLARLALSAGGGHLLAFDRQLAAVEATRQRLADTLSPEQLSRCRVEHACHSRLSTFLTPHSVRLVAFNLGYLPGSESDKSVITEPASTLAALEACEAAIMPGGLLSVMCYTGHAGGSEEAAAVEDFLASLPSRLWTCTRHSLLNRRQAPHLVLAYRLGEAEG